MVELQELPPEIIIKIIYHIFADDSTERDTFTSICIASPFFREICLSSPLLRYQLSLNAAGMIDGDSPLEASAKLERLNRREHAWRALTCSRRTTVRIPFRASHIYDLSAGVYLLGECKTDAPIRETHALRVLDLRRVREVERARDPQLLWKEFTVDAEIVDIAFSLHEFDLLAVVGQRPMEDTERVTMVIFFIELSTGKPHPYARNPEIVVGEALRDWGKTSIMMEIVGPKLVLLMSWKMLRLAPAAHDCLLLIDWQKGHLIIAESAPHATWNGFVFIMPHMIMLPNLAEKTLEMVYLPDNAADTNVPFTRVASFELPSLTSSCVISAVSCRCEPNPFGEPYVPQSDSKDKGKARTQQRFPHRPIGDYQPDPNQSIVLMQFYMRELNMTGPWPAAIRHNASLVIHRHELIMLTAKATSGEIGEPYYKDPHSDEKMEDLASPSDFDEDELDTTAEPASAHSQTIERTAQFESASPSAPGSSSMQNDTDASDPTFGLQPPEDDDPKRSMRVIPWAEWEHVTRWIADEVHVSSWITVSAGQRYVGLRNDGHLVVKDFNPLMDSEQQRLGLEWMAKLGLNYKEMEARKKMYGSEAWHNPGLDEEEGFPDSVFVAEEAEIEAAEAANGGWVYRPRTNDTSEIDDGSHMKVRGLEALKSRERQHLRRIFETDIYEGIPCMEYISRNTFDYHGIMMDEERIIGLRHDNDTGAIVELDVITL